MRVTGVRETKYVDCSISDCFPDGFWEAGYVSLRTVGEYPVSGLPGSECRQYGHETAYGWTRASFKRIRSLLERQGNLNADGLVHVGDLVDVEPAGMRRNKEMRRCGNFRVYL